MRQILGYNEQNGRLHGNDVHSNQCVDGYVVRPSGQRKSLMGVVGADEGVFDEEQWERWRD